MLYLVAVLLPPLAVLMAGKPFQALINLILLIPTVWIGSLIHAIFVVNNFYSDQRTRRIQVAIRDGAAFTAGAMTATLPSAGNAATQLTTRIVPAPTGAPQLMTSVAMYPKPDLGAKAFATIAAGATYELTGTQGAFARIRVQGGPEGWIDRRLIGA